MTKLTFAYFLAASLTLLLACEPRQAPLASTSSNPPAEGFNIENSDEKAIEIADEVMNAMGGRAAWDAVETLQWTFFGNRQHTWMKNKETCKIYSPKNDLTITLNLADNRGTVKKGDQKYEAQDSLKKYLEIGKRWWINDSYWLVMPFKLKDSGVTLKYLQKDTTEMGRMSDVLELTFADVGVTPDNKYLVYVDDSSRLVTQWDYYASYQDSLPRFKSPWPHYQKYGDLLLSGGSIGGRSLTDISIEQGGL